MTRGLTAERQTLPLGWPLGMLAVMLGMMAGLAQHLVVPSVFTGGQGVADVNSSMTAVAVLPLMLAVGAIQFSSSRRVRAWFSCTMAGWMTGLIVVPAVIFVVVHQWLGVPLIP